LNHPKVLAEYKEIEEALRFEREQAETSFGALMKPRIVKRVILGMSIQMWSQLCGMNIMMYYIVFIMRGAGIADELLTASIQYIINVAMVSQSHLLIKIAITNLDLVDSACHSLSRQVRSSSGPPRGFVPHGYLFVHNRRSTGLVWQPKPGQD
jgi:hypothetical protein